MRKRSGCERTVASSPPKSPRGGEFIVAIPGTSSRPGAFALHVNRRPGPPTCRTNTGCEKHSGRLVRVLLTLGVLVVALSDQPAWGQLFAGDINEYADRCACELGRGAGAYMQDGLMPSDGSEIPVYWNRRQISYVKTGDTGNPDVDWEYLFDGKPGVKDIYPDSRNTVGRIHNKTDLRCDYWPALPDSAAPGQTFGGCIPGQRALEKKIGTCTGGPTPGKACHPDTAGDCGDAGECKDVVTWTYIFRRKAPPRSTETDPASPFHPNHFEVMDVNGFKPDTGGVCWFDTLNQGSLSKSYWENACQGGVNAGKPCDKTKPADCPLSVCVQVGIPRPGGQDPDRKARALKFWDTPAQMQAGNCTACHGAGPVLSTRWYKVGGLEDEKDDGGTAQRYWNGAKLLNNPQMFTSPQCGFCHVSAVRTMGGTNNSTCATCAGGFIAEAMTSLGKCAGGANDGALCVTDSQCPGATCSLKICIGGPNGGNTCLVNADCPGGTCQFNAAGRQGSAYRLQSGVLPLKRCTGGDGDIEGAVCTADADCSKQKCDGGVNDGQICTADADCAAKACAGGDNQGAACVDNTNCPGGECKVGTCKTETGTCVSSRMCVGGAQSGNPCLANADCAGRQCEGGDNDRQACTGAADCPGGVCGQPGTCPARVCQGGANSGEGCTVDADCGKECVGGDMNGSACTVAGDCGKACKGGAKHAKACTANADCADAVCVDGANAGAACTVAADCALKACKGGGNEGAFCTADAECRICIDPTNFGRACTADGDCPGGGAGSCPVGTCSPGTCTSGTCDAGACTKSGICVDTGQNAQAMYEVPDPTSPMSPAAWENLNRPRYNAMKDCCVNGQGCGQLMEAKVPAFYGPQKDPVPADPKQLMLSPRQALNFTVTHFNCVVAADGSETCDYTASWDDPDDPYYAPTAYYIETAQADNKPLTQAPQSKTYCTTNTLADEIATTPIPGSSWRKHHELKKKAVPACTQLEVRLCGGCCGASPDDSRDAGLVGTVATFCAICGDLDHDSDVDGDDFKLFADAFGHSPLRDDSNGEPEPDPKWNAEADYNGDGTVGLFDYQYWLQCYRVFVANSTAPAPLQVLGDFDLSGHVTQMDLEHWQVCAGGARVSPPKAGCRDVDLDRDGDVDLDDFGILQRCYTGPDRAIDLKCRQ